MFEAGHPRLGGPIHTLDRISQGTEETSKTIVPSLPLINRRLCRDDGCVIGIPDLCLRIQGCLLGNPPDMSNG